MTAKPSLTVKPKRPIFSDLTAEWERLVKQDWVGVDGAGDKWLRTALCAAVELEFSTIPPYLCALWSVKDQRSPIALAIRGIVQEEMLHMALACNMLVAIGGDPPLDKPDFAPVYPGKLAGGVHPDLTISLAGLSKKVLEGFLVIELPERQSQLETEELKAAFDETKYRDDNRTIGAFYDCIETAFKILEPEFQSDRQVSGPLSWFPINSVEEAVEAIELIKHQGEGSGEGLPSEGGESGTSGDVLAHFYRFLEIYAEREISYLKDINRWGFTGKLAWDPDDAIFPMAEVPEGGYSADEVPDNVRILLRHFDKRYSKLLKQLALIWRNGDQGMLVHAIETMFSLQEPARELMKMQIGSTGQTYGPCFRVVEV